MDYTEVLEEAARKQFPYIKNRSLDQYCKREGFRIGSEWMMERALNSFCEVYNKDCIQCKLVKQIDFGCRETCPAFEQFKDLINAI